MRVAVLGSWRDATTERGWELENRDHFEQACIRVGEELARQGHHLVLAHAVAPTADKLVDQGFDSVNGVKWHYKTVVGIVQHGPWIKAHLGAVQMSDAVIVIGGADGTYTAGQAAILMRKRLIPVPIFGGAAAMLIRDFSTHIDRQLVTVLGSLSPKGDSTWLDKLAKEINLALQDFPRILIIHGRAEDKKLLKETLGNGQGGLRYLPEPMIMSECVRAGETIVDFFEKLAAEADAAIAVVTPEDLGVETISSAGAHLRAIDLKQLYPRARQNVWVEVGWFWGRLGRDRLMLLQRGEIDMPSDLDSIIRQQYLQHPSERIDELEKFVDRIKNRR